jgi:hypothetical protein
VQQSSTEGQPEPEQQQQQEQPCPLEEGTAAVVDSPAPAPPPAQQEQAEAEPPPPASRQQLLPQQFAAQPNTAAIQQQQLSEAAEAEAAPAAALGLEVPLFSSSCQWVTPKKVLSGQLHVTATQLHFIADAPASSLSAWFSGGPAAATAEAQSAAEAGGAEEAAAAPEEEPPRRRHQRWQLRGLTEVHHRQVAPPPLPMCLLPGTQMPQHGRLGAISSPAHPAPPSSRASLQPLPAAAYSPGVLHG